ncbi:MULTISPECIES: hypothetical protein [Aliarcobacter]|jgi:hypothetical protein|uniref:hypothetical protein n=1 Tax=Aliarcobacter TaxID=2321111 RepID=UPI000836C73A|nr:hypothetical protein [Aliarcobacter skirrowii]MDD3025858.1 hypothetical protein [Aliarcobacter skirrowii]MDX4050124.1 hypothetical protein [Aliarcobacter skirrowii]MDX4060082.1 hypothetical protein [Aliarcobacter skirrowii]MDX4071562.1 hypothetical protein [Aliarcobacter skirrowii]MDY0179907.1 hypothetical protein [Aliarcobacter skirrowii]
MTKLLNSAFEEISKLPELEQNIFARFIINEIESEKEWEKQFSNSEDLLSDLANIALKDFKNNKCIELK